MAICRPSMRSSTPARRWTSRPSTGRTFRVVGAPLVRFGVGQCRRRCRRRQQVHAAALGGLQWQRRRNGRAARLRRGRVRQGQQRVRRAAPPAPHGPTAASRSRGGPQGDGAAMRTRQCEERRVRGGGGAGARPLRSPSPPPRRQAGSGYVVLHRWSCALAPARPCVECHAPDLPLLWGHWCACADVPLRHAQPAETNTFRGHAHGTKDALRMHLPAHLPDLTGGVAGQTSDGGDEAGAFPRGARQCERWCPPACLVVPIGREAVTARVPFFLYRSSILERCPS